jgi:glycosyltransferase involved in cell wall biosynthesis
LFEKLSVQQGLDFKVFVDVKTMSHRPFWEEKSKYGFPYEAVDATKIYLPWKIRRKDLGYGWENFSLIPFKLPVYLKRFSPDVVISTELGIRTLLALLYVKIFRKRILVWSDEYLLGMSKHSLLRQRIRKLIVRHVDGFCSCGIENRKYLEVLGAPGTKIINVSIAVDNSFFQRNATDEARERVRKQLGLSGTVFLNVGQLIGRKGLDRLLRIWGSLPQDVSDGSKLLIIGSGSDEEMLKKLTTELNLNNVFFVSSKPIAELPAYYAAADIFIFPTLEDGWGLVVNEAMACGKPILCSKYAGCCPELLKEDVNGYSFDPLDQEDTKKAIIKIFRKQQHELERMGEKSREIVANFNYERMVEGFKKAVFYCLRNEK